MLGAARQDNDSGSLDLSINGADKAVSINSIRTGPNCDMSFSSNGRGIGDERRFGIKSIYGYFEDQALIERSFQLKAASTFVLLR